MDNIDNENEYYKEMYLKLFNEVTNLEEQLQSVIGQMKQVQAVCEEMFIAGETSES